MRRAVLAFVLIAAARPAAAGPAPVDAAPAITSPQVDLLIVVDTSAMAAPLRANVAAQVGGLVDNLVTATGGLPGQPLLDLHVGVISADPTEHGVLRPAPAGCAAAPSDAYVAFALDHHHAPAQNFTGQLADAITCLVPPADATGPDVAQP